MRNLRVKNQEICQNKNSVFLYNSFNIIFKNEFDFIGAMNNQYFFEDYQNELTVGYQQFVLGGQLKILRKYHLGDGKIVMLNKINQFLVIYTDEMIEVCQFDRFHNCIKCQTIHLDEDPDQDSSLYDLDDMIQDIGINQNQDMFVFQRVQEICFYKRGKDCEWEREQTIFSFDYFEMQQIRFNESTNKMITQQANENRSFFLTIFNKSQQDIWSITHRISRMNNDDLFCFINDQQFVYFKPNKNLKLIYEISKNNYEAQKKSQEYFQFGDNFCELIEIKSKHLIAVKSQKFFHLIQQNSLNLLKQFPFENIYKIDCHQNQHCSFLFFNIMDDSNDRTNFQVYSMHVE